MQHRDIIKKFGGVRPMARILGHEHHTRVQQWHARQAIPLRYAPEILQAAKKHKIKLRLADFFAGSLQ